MTVSYTSEVAQCSGFGCFLKLLLRWRASIYKLVWLDLLIYLSIYYVLNFSYRFVMSSAQRARFETMVQFCQTNLSLIPLMFVLGFYVSIVVKRWWEQYMSLPWPDTTAVYVSSLIRGQDERGRKMRRTIMRYVCLSITMVFAMISPSVKKRFPTFDHMVNVGLLKNNEKEIMNSMNEKFSKHPKYWMPIVWASSIVTRARKEGRLRDDSSVQTIIGSVNECRGKCMSLTFYDTISIPLVYTQVVTIAVYTYFCASVVGRQWTARNAGEDIIDIIDYFPVFTVLEFLFFMGWLKVAESLICPFGDDDDDFELNWMIDRNLQVSYLIVDGMHNEHPDLLEDQVSHGAFPPNSIHSLKKMKSYDPPQPSTARSDEHQTRRTFFGIPIFESITNFFFRGENMQKEETASVYANINEINSTLKRFFDPQSLRVAVDPEELPVAPRKPLSTKSSRLVVIKSNTSVEKRVLNVSDDEFERLKQTRMKQRAERQNFLIAVPKNLDIDAEDQASLSLAPSPKDSESSNEKSPQEKKDQ